MGGNYYRWVVPVVLLIVALVGTSDVAGFSWLQEISCDCDSGVDCILYERLPEPQFEARIRDDGVIFTHTRVCVENDAYCPFLWPPPGDAVLEYPITLPELEYPKELWCTDVYCKCTK